jgi:hypothetical protein
MSCWLRLARDRSPVLDPLENLFPMDRDIFRCIDSKTDLIAVHAKHRHDDVRTDPNDFANSRERINIAVFFLNCPCGTLCFSL